MALSEQTAARLVGFDELGVQVQISTLQVIEADLRRALSGGRARAARWGPPVHSQYHIDATEPLHMDIALEII